ncbi:MAG: SusC/RagA family TonB-linked outer membrane protein, partial [Bacteroidota bacterium]
MKRILQSIELRLYMRSTLVLIFVLCISTVALAQNTVSGKVVDETGEGLPGVAIQIQKSTVGTITDINGDFTLQVEAGAVLVISYVGFKTEVVPVNDRSFIEVKLAVDATELSEVIVVGYGTRKKSHNTGAIAQVEGNDIAAIQAVRVDDALAGKLSGVLIQNQSGEPGADPRIQVRASSSINGNASPLIVVDGYPIQGSLATVNPNDIESIEVLKDAASAAIYGSRGANGVILVATKKGRSGRPTFSYNAYTSISNKYRDNILTTGPEWADQIDANIANGTFDVSEVDEDILNLRRDFFRNSADVQSVEDWLFQTGNTQSHDLSLRGGSEDVSVFASIGFIDTEGVAITQAFERYNGRLNVDAKLGEKFKAGITLNGNVSDRAILAHDMRDLLRSSSIHPVIHTEASIAFVQQLNARAQALGLDPFDNGFGGGNADSATPMNSSISTLVPGDYAHDWHYGGRTGLWRGSSNQGPAAKLFERSNTQRNYFGNVNSYLQYSIIDGLDIKTAFGADLSDTEANSHQLSQADRRGQISRTALNQTNTKRSSVQSETTLSYTKVVGNHDISAVAGVEFQNIYIDAVSVAGGNLPSDDPLNFSLVGSVNVTERDENISRRSVFGRINYAYDDRYLVSVSLRRDGDSRFGTNNRFETFPAISIGWNAHNESFYNVEFLSNLRLRFSTGSIGTTSDLGAFNSLSLLNPQPTVLGNGFLIPQDVANPDLTWQTNTETNFGINLGFLKNRITLAVDYYTSDIEDILINQSVSEVLGTPSVRLNAGDVKSSGLEIELGAVVVEKGDFNWNVSANLSTVDTEITDLNGLDELAPTIYGQSGRGPVFRNYVGGTIGEMWGLQTIGEVESEHLADPTVTPGLGSRDVYVVDQNGDGVIDATRTVEEGGDLVKIGQNTPDFYWGLNSTIKYKDFDLSLQFQGSQGGEVYNIDPLYFESPFFGTPRSSFDADGDGIADIGDNAGEHFIRK